MRAGAGRVAAMPADHAAPGRGGTRRRARGSRGHLLRRVAAVRAARDALRRALRRTRRERIASARPVGPERYAEAGHVTIETRPGAFSRLQALLTERGIARRSMVVVPHFLLALLSPSPARPTSRPWDEGLARSLASRHPVRVVELGLDLPDYEISQIWHERPAPTTAWRGLRERISAVLGTRASKQAPKARRKHVVRA